MQQRRRLVLQMVDNGSAMCYRIHSRRATAHARRVLPTKMMRSLGLRYPAPILMELGFRTLMFQLPDGNCNCIIARAFDL